MQTNEEKESLDQLSVMPKPELNQEKQTKILGHLQQFAEEKEKRKWRMSMLTAGKKLMITAAILLAAVISFDLLRSGGDIQENSLQTAETGDDTFSALGPHEVGLVDLYFGISPQKDDVAIKREEQDGYMVVTVQDPKTGAVIYKAGESIKQSNVKTVYRELETKEGTARITAEVEFDKINRKILKVSEDVVFSPTPDDQQVLLSHGPRNGSFPADEVEIIANIRMRWGENSKQYVDMYEGLAIGVIPDTSSFEDFFHKRMEKNKEDYDENVNYSYNLIYHEHNVVHQNDAIAIFTEHNPNGDQIFIAYFENEDGQWYWRQTRGAEWDSWIQWSSMNEIPYIYSGALSDPSVKKVYAGTVEAKIIDVTGSKRFWYAISSTKETEVKVEKKDGSQEILEQFDEEMLTDKKRD